MNRTSDDPSNAADADNELYQRLISLARWEGDWFWSRWQHFLFANSILFGVVGLSESPPATLVTIVAVAGLVVSLCWWHTAVQSDICHRMRIYQARDLEAAVYPKGNGPFSSGGEIMEDARRTGEFPAFKFEKGTTPHKLQWPSLWRYGDFHVITARVITTQVVPLSFALSWVLILATQAYGGDPLSFTVWSVTVAAIFGVIGWALRGRVKARAKDSVTRTADAPVQQEHEDVQTGA